MPEIASIHNPKIKWLRELMQKRSSREEEKLFVVEGVRLAEEAFLQGQKPEEVFYSGSLSERGMQLVGNFQNQQVPVTLISEDLIQRISGTENSQGIILVMPWITQPMPNDLNFMLVLDSIRDPGNAGTMLRTAAASGVQSVIAAPGTVDLFAPKVVRSGMGAHFRLNIQSLAWNEIAGLCKKRAKPLKILLAAADADQSLWQQDLREPVTVVIGSEAEGASTEARRYADGAVFIPMPGGFESLNAAVAAGVILFEVVRQREP